MPKAKATCALHHGLLTSALLSNPWEDKFFSMLMGGANADKVNQLNQLAAAQQASTGQTDLSGMMNPTPMADAAAQLNAMNMMNAMVSQSSSMGGNNNSGNNAATSATNTAGV